MSARLRRVAWSGAALLWIGAMASAWMVLRPTASAIHHAPARPVIDHRPLVAGPRWVFCAPPSGVPGARGDAMASPASQKVPSTEAWVAAITAVAGASVAVAVGSRSK